MDGRTRAGHRLASEMHGPMLAVGILELNAMARLIATVGRTTDSWILGVHGNVRPRLAWHGDCSKGSMAETKMAVAIYEN